VGCLLLQSILVVTALRFYERRRQRAAAPTFSSSLAIGGISRRGTKTRADRAVRSTAFQIIGLVPGAFRRAWRPLVRIIKVNTADYTLNPRRGMAHCDRVVQTTLRVRQLQADSPPVVHPGPSAGRHRSAGRG